ncbi:MAG: hypothetical protein QOG09_87, partial [Solirubrobacterales bacterium]|nr:hypothetical protein [Solirubrobacterales bacterium]
AELRFDDLAELLALARRLSRGRS